MPYSQHVSVNEIWRRSAISLREKRRHTQLTGTTAATQHSPNQRHSDKRFLACSAAQLGLHRVKRGYSYHLHWQKKSVTRFRYYFRRRSEAIALLESAYFCTCVQLFKTNFTSVTWPLKRSERLNPRHFNLRKQENQQFETQWAFLPPEFNILVFIWNKSDHFGDEGLTNRPTDP